MILRPRLVVLDEPTSSLDRSVQKEILKLLRALQDSHELSYIFISHDLAVVRAMADEILVMKDGRIVEQGPTAEIFDNPREDYTRESDRRRIPRRRGRADESSSRHRRRTCVNPTTYSRARSARGA